MKTSKIYILIIIFIFLGLLFLFWQFRPTESYEAVLNENYNSKCDSPESVNQLFICYEIEVEAKEHQPINFVHESGKVIKVLSFIRNGKTWVRFTAELPGIWTVKGVSLFFDQSTPEYANGFLTAAGNKWIQSAKGNAVIPQYIMYNKPTISVGIQEFIKDQGFSGFHIANLRDFLKNPEYFEAVVLDTYRAGGMTHFWIWGDKQRKLTPEHYEGDVNYLYNEILARLGPIPGWSVGYGFDLFEWASASDLNKWKESWNSAISYSHMMGARGYKNEYKEISPEMDYMSWEWHRPDIEDYIKHLQHSNNKPVFSEDRFRIRRPSKYPLKDYTEELTISGLWNSFIAGGVANIWGNRGSGKMYSKPYEMKSGIRKYRDVVDKYYHTSSVAFKPLENLNCITSQSKAICRSHDAPVSVSELRKKGIIITDIIDIESGQQKKADKIEFITEDVAIIGVFK
ncbi:MAG: hypothetical protein WBB23_12915 [Desulforhopalus sp.]